LQIDSGVAAAVFDRDNVIDVVGVLCTAPLARVPIPSTDPLLERLVVIELLPDPSWVMEQGPLTHRIGSSKSKFHQGCRPIAVDLQPLP